MRPLWPRPHGHVPPRPLRPDELDGARVAVWGAARSGIAAANLLTRLGAQVLLSDVRAEPELKLDGLNSAVQVSGGGNVLDGASVVVPSPGIPPAAPIFRTLGGARLVSEIELAASVTRASIVAITGTDGKSTTTLMTARGLEAAGRKVVACGNLGNPMCDHVDDVGPDGVMVAEVSAFQLWSCGHFRARVAVVTNVAEDHADHFGGEARAYALSKARLLENQRPGDVAILRAEDPVVSRFEVAFGVRRVDFGLGPEGPWGFDGTHLLSSGQPVIGAEALRVPGRHNVSNALAALAAGEALGVDAQDMVAGVAGFEGLPHRLQHVATLSGIRIYDDSKATNPHAAAVGLASLDGPVVAICGGFDKQIDPERLVRSLVSRARAVVLLGQTSDELAAALGDRVPVSRATSMAEAVRLAFGLAQAGDAMVLSPGASSFDLFKSYAHRGEVYQAEVKALIAR